MRGVRRILLSAVLVAGVVSVPMPAQAAPPNGWREVGLPFLWSRRTLGFVEAAGPSDVWIAGAQGQVAIPQPTGGVLWTPGNPVVRRLKDGAWHEYPLDGWPGWAQVTGLSQSGDDVFVTGPSDPPYVARFDGTRFKPVSLPAGARRVYVRPGPGGTWAVSGQWHDRALLRWVDGAFQKVELPAGYLLHDVVAVGPNDVWAVGRQGEGDATRPASLHWNGKTWTSYPVPDLGFYDSLYQVFATSSGEVWASDTSFENTGTLTTLLRWTGSAWVKVKVPQEAQSPLASDGAGRLVLPGSTSTGTGAVFRWTGSGWQTTEFPSSPNTRFFDVDGAPGTSALWTVAQRDLTPVMQTNAP
ncbi:hypothetical protein J4573_51105 [Actinomadura barringtoniae]|uniref:Uncharacterized protein n=1 Tax=Actinomadura barringtoniae TaxID=1427535 RepID=A0A939PVE4_9ACTN|nr:hypothetical protein [Actinomadura barringtoniae]MBO2455506.1 hypothetical protein [Actinomadura barringtoniae]